jgi:hypothetical protein
MNRIRPLTLAATLGTVLLVASWAAGQTPSQSADPQPAQKLSAEQQKQLDHLKQLEEQLRKDREALHAAITQHSWDSDQTDAATDQLFRDRQEYRQTRRSLRTAGVAVPPSTGMAWRARPDTGRGYGLRRGRARWNHLGRGRSWPGWRDCRRLS